MPKRSRSIWVLVAVLAAILGIANIGVRAAMAEGGGKDCTKACVYNTDCAVACVCTGSWPNGTCG